jgi:hypothetical protein
MNSEPLSDMAVTVHLHDLRQMMEPFLGGAEPLSVKSNGPTKMEISPSGRP